MIRRSLAILPVAIISVVFCSTSMRAQTSSFSGAWSLNPALTQAPAEIGFNTALAPEPDGSAPGSRGRGATGTGRPFIIRPESADDASRLRQLTDEVRQPSKRLTIADAPAEVVVTDDQGQTRTFHPNGTPELIQLGDIPVNLTAQRTAGQMVVVYEVEAGRQLRYTYARQASPAQLIVDVEFVGRGGGDHVRHVYEPPSTPAPSSSTAPGAQPASHPDDKFKNLTTVGVLVEDLSSQSTACGLTQSAIESAVSKRLTEGGLKVRRYADDAPYVYVEIVTTSLSNGVCVSRYDASVITHAMASLSYQQTQSLVEISLLHEGGITGGNPAAHAENVMHGLLQYLDQFVARIRDANK